MTKPNDFLAQLLEPSRAKILRLFILNDAEHFTPVEIARRASVTARSAKHEVEALKKMGIIKEERSNGGQSIHTKSVRYRLDSNFKFTNALSTFIHEVTPTQFGDVEQALKRTGRLNVVILSGVFMGDTTRPADLLIAGDYIHDERLEKVVRTFEPKYGREIRYAVFSTPEFRYRLTIHDKLLRDTLDFPHRVLINKSNLI